MCVFKELLIESRPDKCRINCNSFPQEMFGGEREGELKSVSLQSVNLLPF